MYYNCTCLAGIRVQYYCWITAVYTYTDTYRIAVRYAMYENIQFTKIHTIILQHSSLNSWVVVGGVFRSQSHFVSIYRMCQWHFKKILKRRNSKKMSTSKFKEEETAFSRGVHMNGHHESDCSFAEWVNLGSFAL